MLPIVALTTEEALKLIPNHQRLGSAALGANRLQTTFRVVVAAAIPAITTGVLLAVARAAGETAPLLFTALFSISWPDGLFNPTPSLSVLIYNYANSPDLGQNQMAWTAALVLVGLVLCISIISRLATRRRQ
jgi:phosphate transport system permease protein